MKTILTVSSLFLGLCLLGCESDCPAGSTAGADGRCLMGTVPIEGGAEDAGSDAVTEDAVAGDAGCASSAACNDDDPCNGEEMCNAGTCEAGEVPTELLPCGMGEAAGVCVEGTCRPPGCGNGLPDVGEQCDDGNDVADDGCEEGCTFSCTDDAGCDNADACDGMELCNMTTHTCEDGVAPDCEDSDACTADSCDAASGCVNALIDEDGDGYAALDTCTTEGLRGGDCEPTLALVHPGAAGQAEPYCPDGASSCLEAAETYDYNCDSTITRTYPTAGAPPMCDGSTCGVFRWSFHNPTCGGSANASWCRFYFDPGTGLASCRAGSGSQTQTCR